MFIKLIVSWSDVFVQKESFLKSTQNFLFSIIAEIHIVFCFLWLFNTTRTNIHTKLFTDKVALDANAGDEL